MRGITTGLLTAFIYGSIASPIQVDPRSQLFVDGDGRVRIFHGVNAVYKVKPFHPDLTGFNTQTSLSSKDFELLSGWGLNVVRLGLMWSAVEEVQGSPNMTYLGIMKDLVNQMGEAGIYTILDAHEDVMNPLFCGEGIPTWAIQPASWTEGNASFPWPVPAKLEKNAQGVPNITQCQEYPFFEFMLAAETNSAWGALYSKDELKQAFAQHWKNVAGVFADSPYVLGYELINEPWPGDLYKDPLLIVENGKADRDNLAPLYEAAYAAIREVDDDHIVMYEPSVMADQVMQSAGFTNGPGGNTTEANSKQALAYHIYCPPGANGTSPNWEFCKTYMDIQYDVVQKDFASIGGGHFMTEFGSVGDDPVAVEILNHYTDTIDEYLGSWAYWTYKGYKDITTQNDHTETFFNPDGSQQTPKITALSRTYAPVVAGEPGSIQMHFNATSAGKDFTLSFVPNTGATNTTTEIYLNEELNYPNGYKTAVEGGGSLTALAGGNRLKYVPADGSTERVTISIYAAPSGDAEE